MRLAKLCYLYLSIHLETPFPPGSCSENGQTRGPPRWQGVLGLKKAQNNLCIPCLCASGPCSSPLGQSLLPLSYKVMPRQEATLAGHLSSESLATRLGTVLTTLWAPCRTRPHRAPSVSPAPTPVHTQSEDLRTTNWNWTWDLQPLSKKSTFHSREIPKPANTTWTLCDIQVRTPNRTNPSRRSGWSLASLVPSSYSHHKC